MKQTLFLLSLTLNCNLILGEDWPQFRGPDGQGHSRQKTLPLSWSETENIVWKVPISGSGWSSPVVQGNLIWLTSALDAGRSLRAVCLDLDSGKIIHNVEVFRTETPGTIHSKNSYASPTPLLEKDRVYLHYGTNGTACLSNNGQLVWKNQLKYNHGHGPGGSPILYEHSLIVSCDGTDIQYVTALDKNNGKILWKRPRQGRMAYSTPLVIEYSGRPQLISTGGDQVISYDPETGKEIWWLRYNGFSGVPRPVFGHGLIFVCSGYESPVLYAIRPNGTGDVTATHMVWRLSRGAPLNPSPILVGDEIYVVSDIGVATCLDARTGKIHWKKRIGGNFSASPLYGAERIYFLNEDGETTIVAPKTSFRELGKNNVQGRTLASLAVSGKSLLLRTDTHLYRIEEKTLE